MRSETALVVPKAHISVEKYTLNLIRLIPTEGNARDLTLKKFKAQIRYPALTLSAVSR